MSSGGVDKHVAPGAKLSIGALSRATGIPTMTLRTWERRYGFPVPERKPSGHRVYALGDIPRLRRIAEALSMGHRAAEVVAASDIELQALLRTSPPISTPLTADLATLASSPAGSGGTEASASPSDEMMRAVESLDGERLTHLLLMDWARLGPVSYLNLRVAPLICTIGQAWADRTLDIRHEHFLTERVSDLLRSLRIPYEERARGPLVVLATLPGEGHGIGIQMAALVLAAAGLRLINLGTDLPVREIAAVAHEQRAAAVGLSVSIQTGGASTRTQVRRLRRALSPEVRLLVGGEGAREQWGVEVVRDLAALDVWARNVAVGL